MRTLLFYFSPYGLPRHTTDVFTAVQEQLGSKIESSKAPVQLLVIDSAQKPSENR
jgi:uncharacterized protein (TIGR03435 family)